MSQKVNPINNKLGILQTWPAILPKYGKNFKYYNKVLCTYLNILVYTTRFLKTNKILADSINIYSLRNNIFMNVGIFLYKLDFDFLKLKALTKVLSYWSKMSVIVHFYNKSSFTNSSFLLLNYLIFLVNKESSPKKVLQDIHKIFCEQLPNIKLVKTNQGIKKVEFKGFKLKLSGCFEVSRNQMAKTINYSFGSLPLTCFNGYTEYSYNTLYTKFGSCGLKIWIFYEFKS